MQALLKAALPGAARGSEVELTGELRGGGQGGGRGTGRGGVVDRLLIADKEERMFGLEETGNLDRSTDRATELIAFEWIDCLDYTT